MPVLHPESAGDGAKLHKAKPFIQMPSVSVALHYRIELQHPETKLFCLLQAIQHQLFADMLPANGGGNRIARVTDMPTAPDIVRMQDIQPDDLSVRVCYACITLGRKKSAAG